MHATEKIWRNGEIWEAPLDIRTQQNKQTTFAILRPQARSYATKLQGL